VYLEEPFIVARLKHMRKPNLEDTENQDNLFLSKNPVFLISTDQIKEDI